MPDFSPANPAAGLVDLESDQSLFDFYEETTASHPNSMWVGGYGEDRVWYQRSEHYLTEHGYRSIHLGVDYWLPAGSKIHSPLNATVHSFADNQGRGNYGPTVILEHRELGQAFFSLYGHLDRKTLDVLEVGKSIRGGECFARLGKPSENGAWPPHLHFQLIWDLEANQGDYPGVATPKEAPRYLANCPDPNLLLGVVLD